MDINTIAGGKTQYVACEFRLQRFRTITEVGFGGSHMRRVRHRIFPLLGKPENIVGQLSTLGGVQYIICHNQLSFAVIFEHLLISKKTPATSDLLTLSPHPRQKNHLPIA